MRSRAFIFYHSEGIVINAEVVSYLVTHNLLHLSFNLLVISTYALNGLLEDGYPVGQHQVVATPSLGLGYSLVETQ